jgi:hypothetical protein
VAFNESNLPEAAEVAIDVLFALAAVNTRASDIPRE